MKNLEDTVREYYNEINSLTITQEMVCRSNISDFNKLNKRVENGKRFIYSL